MQRLIVCQGSAQLVTAVSALREHIQRTGWGDRDQPSSDHLLICGLAVPEQQVQEFADVIERMAAYLHPFASISRMDDSTLDHLIEDSKRCQDHKEIVILLQKAIGLGSMDEVFTVRNWQACNEVALCAFPDATHICYGDSVGVCLPKSFVSAKPSPWSWALAQARRILPSFKSPFDNPRIDINYFLLPGAFSMPPGGEVVQTKVSTLLELFTCLTPLLNSPELEELQRKTVGRSVWFLIGTNFSEQGLMSLEAEVSAYREWIEGLNPEPGAVLLIKSHPRDHKDKRPILEQRLEGIFDKILSADAVGSAYLPVEVILLELGLIVGDLRCLTASTACLGTHFVVKSKTDIGLGDALVERYLPPNRRQQRLRHERDLRRLCMV